jgi:hypothetical protein
MQNGNSNRTPESGCRDLQTTLINVGLMNIASPSSGLTEENFENLNNLSNELHLHTVVLSEHQLPSTDPIVCLPTWVGNAHIPRPPKKRQ